MPTNARSWTNAGLAQEDLLYATNVDNEVTVYDYANQTLVGVLTGFTQPMGECSDGSGNVYITDYAAEQILEYVHGGSKPFKKLSDAPDHPYVCSVDSKTGNLAVANDDGSSQEGDIAIWPQGTGSPTRYTDSSIANFEGCAYDPGGNLLVESGYVGYGYATYFAWLPHGGNRLINLYVPGPKAGWKWDYILGVQWDGKFFALDDSNIYRIALSHGQAYYVGEVPIKYEYQGENGPYAFYLKKPAKEATEVIGGANGEYGSSVNFWTYPSGSGGLSITHGIDRPFGVAISLAKN
jgi:hypothetical protein